MSVLCCYCEPVFNYPASRGPSIDLSRKIGGPLFAGYYSTLFLAQLSLTLISPLLSKCVARLAQVGEHRSAGLPRLAFLLFAGQTIQLLYFCIKNKVVVVVVGLNPDRTNSKGLLKKLVRSFWLWFETLSRFKSWWPRHWAVTLDCNLSLVKSKGI